MAPRRLSPFLVLALLAAPLSAQLCSDPSGDGRLIGFTLLPGTVTAAANCTGILRCYPPLLQGVRYETRPVSCNPYTTVCQVAAIVPTVFRGNTQNSSVVTGHTEWTDANGVSAGSCGALGAAIRSDFGESWIVIGGFSCANPEGLAAPSVFSLLTNICAGASGCTASRTVPVELTPLAAYRALCGQPPPFGCPEDPPAGTCCLGPGGGTAPAGGGPGASPPGRGPLPE